MRGWALLPLVLAVACRGEPAAFEPVVRFEGQGLGVAWDEVPQGEEARRQALAAAREGARQSEAGEEVGALAHLRRAVDLDPRALEGWRRLAAGFERLGDVDAALRVIRGARVAWPREPGLLYDLGRLIFVVRQSRGASDLAEAEGAWSALLGAAADPSQREEVRRRLPELARALALARTGPAARPAVPGAPPPSPAAPAGGEVRTGEDGADAEGAVLAGNEFMERGDFPEAARVYGNAVRRRPEDAEARRLLGWAHFRAGDYRAAVAAWEDLSRRRKLDGETARLLEEARRKSR